MSKPSPGGWKSGFVSYQVDRASTWDPTFLGRTENPGGWSPARTVFGHPRSGVRVHIVETDLLTQKEALGGEDGEAVTWRSLRRAVCRRGFAHVALLLLGQRKASYQPTRPTITAAAALTRSGTFAFPLVFFALIFLAAVFLTGLGFFSGAGERGVSSLPLAPLFLASSSGWMLGRTPPAAIVTPFSNWKHTKLHPEFTRSSG